MYRTGRGDRSPAASGALRGDGRLSDARQSILCGGRRGEPGDIWQSISYYYVYDVAAHLATLEALAVMDVDWIVPSHAEPTREAGPLVAANKAKILEVGERILELCGPSLSMGPATPES